MSAGGNALLQLLEPVLDDDEILRRRSDSIITSSFVPDVISVKTSRVPSERF
jgi:hypothetical protein